MDNIGQRIKELRRKNDMTQEKLADFLGVTHKAVSKWECGVTMPDISLILPLAKILHVSTDELLGFTQELVDERRTELDEELNKAWKDGGESDGFALVYDIQKVIVKEYPNDMKALCELAYTEYNRAFHSKDKTSFINNAIHHFETVIENTNDMKIKARAVQGIVRALSTINKYSEAVKYASLLPEDTEITKSRVLESCLRGRELLKARQERLASTLHTLILLMEQCSDDKLNAICDCEKILKVFFPEGEYLEYHYNLVELLYRKAVICTKHKMYDEAIEALSKYKMHSIMADKVDVHSKELQYTSPYFNQILLPPNAPEERYTPSCIETFYIQIENEEFGPLRTREDFKELLK